MVTLLESLRELSARDKKIRDTGKAMAAKMNAVDKAAKVEAERLRNEKAQRDQT